MKVQKIAAFSDGDSGGNPAGVHIGDCLPDEVDMQRIAAELGFSETVFAAPKGSSWRVRYFSPQTEIPFCGHATIALGAALAKKYGDGVYALELNQASITVEGRQEAELFMAALQSPNTYSKVAPVQLVSEILALFGYSQSDINPRIPAALAHAGADHLIVGLNSRKALSIMNYDFEVGRKLMQGAGLVTIVFAYAESASQFHTRNPFASGGVYEDPATGAGSAALAGYLRDIAWPHGGFINVVQGEDMGIRSRMRADITPTIGASIRVSGTTRMM